MGVYFLKGGVHGILNFFEFLKNVFDSPRKQFHRFQVGALSEKSQDVLGDGQLALEK